MQQDEIMCDGSAPEPAGGTAAAPEAPSAAPKRPAANGPLRWR